MTESIVERSQRATSRASMHRCGVRVADGPRPGVSAGALGLGDGTSVVGHHRSTAEVRRARMTGTATAASTATTASAADGDRSPSRGVYRADFVGTRHGPGCLAVSPDWLWVGRTRSAGRVIAKHPR